MKLYVEEPGTDDVGRWVAAATVVATARIAYAEARAAFARHRREGALSPAQLRRVVDHLDADWRRYALVEISDAVVHHAGRLAERHGRRGFDALHLAAAIELRTPRTRIGFGCFDERLNRAARRERLLAPPPAGGEPA